MFTILIKKWGGPLDYTPGSLSGWWLYGMVVAGVAAAGDTVWGWREYSWGACQPACAQLCSTSFAFGSQWLRLDQVTSDPKNLKKMLINEHKNKKIYNWIIGSQNNCNILYVLSFFPLYSFFYIGVPNNLWSMWSNDPKPEKCSFMSIKRMKCWISFGSQLWSKGRYTSTTPPERIIYAGNRGGTEIII